MNVTGLTQEQIKKRVLDLYEVWQDIEKEMEEKNLRKQIMHEYMTNPNFKNEIDAKLGIEDDKNSDDDDEKI